MLSKSIITGSLTAALSLLACQAHGQDRLWGRPIQIHGFASQGYARTDGNNWLTTRSGRGTFSFTDGGLNASMQVGEKFRVGAQAYSRNIGHMGEGRVELDWAFGDYRFRDWFGVRAGKVKTAFGLYTDTQDMSFLHTWALLPQSVYPLDLRGITIAHTGADVYGVIPARKLGSFAYTAYAGKAPGDRTGGRVYGVESFGFYTKRASGSMLGADLKWTTPIPNLMVGASMMTIPYHMSGQNLLAGGTFAIDAEPAHNTGFSAQYLRGPLRLEWEYSRLTSVSTIRRPFGDYGPPSVAFSYDSRGQYAAFAYRISKKLELGTYHSRFYPNSDKKISVYGLYAQPYERHIFDQTFTARIDVRNHWDLKVEGHFMDGYGDAATSRGFYPQDNPQGLKPKTNMLVIRLGFNR